MLAHEPGSADRDGNSKLRVLHFADLHLDSPFAWAEASGDAARARRQALRETLRRILALAVSERVNAIFCGGDLYEQERFTPDTAEFLRTEFASAAPVPVYISPGNHDWLGPQSPIRHSGHSGNLSERREVLPRCPTPRSKPTAHPGVCYIQRSGTEETPGR